MTETIADRYRRRAAAFTDAAAAVPADRWGDPTPCEEWTTRQLVGHVIDTQGLFAGFVGEEIEPGPSVDDDPVAAWEFVRDQTQAFLDDPEVAGRGYEAFGGATSTYARGVDQFLSFDLVVHRWDLAKATGGDTTIPAADVEAMAAAIAVMSEKFGDAMRGPGAFGPELHAPDGCDEQTRALAFIGRRDW